MSKLNNKVAVCHRGSSGIGLATARRFIAEGARVIITGRNQEALDTAVAELGNQATGIRGDVANLGDLDRLFADWTGHRFTDLFALLKIDGEWKIMNKVFHLHP